MDGYSSTTTSFSSTPFPFYTFYSLFISNLPQPSFVFIPNQREGEIERMGTPTRFVHSASIYSMQPFSQTPAALPLSRSPLSIPSLPRRRSSSSSSFSAARDKKSFLFNGDVRREKMVKGTAKRKGEEREKGEEIMLYSINPYPLLLLAALPGAETLRTVFGPIVELVKAWNLPEWLVHWGHPGNMAVVLFAMGGYGSYLGFRIRLSKDAKEKAMAKDLHPKLLAGMFFFFALGALGGIISLLTSGKPILESPHAVSGLMGLSLLAVQTVSPALFEDYPGMRTVHGLLGSSIMTLFLLHAALGLQLGLSF